MIFIRRRQLRERIEEHGRKLRSLGADPLPPPSPSEGRGRSREGSKVIPSQRKLAEVQAGGGDREKGPLSRRSSNSSEFEF